MFVLDCINYLTVSPKKSGDLANMFQRSAGSKINEIRIAFDAGEECRKILAEAIYFNKKRQNPYRIYISPIFVGGKSPYIDLAIECVKNHNADNVFLSVQEHKLLNIR
jgi:organic radical activating enzyme